MLPNMRKCENLSEFREKLKSIKREEEPFLVWASIENVRSLANAKVTSGLLRENNLIVSFKLDERLDDPIGKNLYFYCEKVHALFKGKVTRAGNKAIEVIVSGTPFLAEFRASPRFEFPNIQYFIEVSTYQEQKDNVRHHQVVLRNISPTGFAFTVSINRAQRFQKGNKIALTRIEKLDLPKTIVGKIAHVTVLESMVGDSTDPDFNRLIMVGAKFDIPSPIIGDVVSSL